tara:strand:- start:1278 stop:2132 length:855 start_codon:yes stop_codon:yes gene_type:complete
MGKFFKEAKVNAAGNYTKPEMRKRIFQRIKSGGKGGNPGQWSARKAQMLAKAYKAAGGGYTKTAELKSSQKSLKKWTKQEWTTPSGKKSSDTGEVYLPKKKIENLKSTKEGKQRLAKANKIKRDGYKKGKQFTRHGEAAGQGYEKTASVKDLKAIVKELFKASKMHKGQAQRIDNIVKSMTKKASVEYRGHTFPGYNKPMKSWRPGKKKVVLAKKGNKVKVVHFGASGYGHNYSAAARKSYLARSAKIKGADDKFSANYWARKVLWAGKGGSTKSSPKNVKGKY